MLGAHKRKTRFKNSHTFIGGEEIVLGLLCFMSRFNDEEFRVHRRSCAYSIKQLMTSINAVVSYHIV